MPTYKDSGVVKVATPNLANSSPKTMKLGRDILLQAKIRFNRPKVLMTHGHFQVTTTSIHHFDALEQIKNGRFLKILLNISKTIELTFIKHVIF